MGDFNIFLFGGLISIHLRIIFDPTYCTRAYKNYLCSGIKPSPVSDPVTTTRTILHALPMFLEFREVDKENPENIST